jgi:hypothetical protein
VYESLYHSLLYQVSTYDGKQQGQLKPTYLDVINKQANFLRLILPLSYSFSLLRAVFFFANLTLYSTLVISVVCANRVYEVLIDDCTAVS